MKGLRILGLALLGSGCIAAEADRAAALMCATPGGLCEGSPLLNTLPPRIKGRLEPCVAVEADPGGWQRAPQTYAFQWLRCASAEASTCVESALTGPSLVIPAAWAGSRVGLRVTATRGAISESTVHVSAGPIATPSSPGFDVLESFDSGAHIAGSGATAFDEYRSVTIGVGRHGGALRILGDAANPGFARKGIPPGALGLSVRFAFSSDALVDQEMVRFTSASGELIAAIVVGRTGARLTARGGLLSNSLSVLSVNRWNMLAFRLDVASGLLEMRLNGGTTSLSMGTEAAQQITSFTVRHIRLLTIDDYGLKFSGAELLPDGAVLRIPLSGDLPHVNPARFTLPDFSSAAQAVNGLTTGQHVSQIATDPEARLRFALAPPPGAATDLRAVFDTRWTGPEPYPAKLRFRSNLSNVELTSGFVAGPVHSVVSRRAAFPPHSLCELAASELSWGEATSTSPVPRLHGVLLEGNFSP